MTHGDRIGPMDELAPGIWLDQYGTWYAPDGRQMNHALGSTANLVKRVDPWTALTVAPSASGK